MVFEKPRVNRLAPAETLVHAMPELNARLAQLPAQVNFLALEERRKVDEPNVQILYQDRKSVV